MSSFSMRSIDFTFYFVRFEGCFDMNVAIDNHETHFQLSTLVSFSDKPVGWRIGFVLFSVIYQQVTVKVCKAFMYFFLVTLCFVVSFSSISLLITIVIFHDASAFVVKLNSLYIQNLHLSIHGLIVKVFSFSMCIYIGCFDCFFAAFGPLILVMKDRYRRSYEQYNSIASFMSLF